MVIGDVGKVLESLGIEYTEESGEYRALCPMHRKRTGKQDRDPSFYINAESGLGICFSCNYRCNLVGLVADIRGITRVKAEGFIEESPLHLDLEKITELLQRPIRPYRVPYDRFPESALARFEEPPQWAVDARRLQPDSISAFRVRWMQDADQWILPIRHATQGYLLGWQAKSQTRKGFVRNRPKSVRKSHTLFGVDVCCDPDQPVWLVESPLDAVRLHGLGIAAVSSFGSAVSRGQIEILSCYSRVVLALDNDDSGMKSIEKIRRDALPLGIDLSVVFYPDHAKDPGDLTDDEVLDLEPVHGLVC